MVCCIEKQNSSTLSRSEVVALVCQVGFLIYIITRVIPLDLANLHSLCFDIFTTFRNPFEGIFGGS
jgi:hypothetical protein